MLNHSINTGLSFGFTSGVITTLGLMVSLQSGTHFKLAVIGGIVGIAVADAFSDALGIHVSEEAERKHTNFQIWQSTLTAFLAKFFTAIIFIFPVLFLDSLSLAVLVNIFLGLFLILIFNLFLAKGQKGSQAKVILEHLLITILVVILSSLAGDFIEAKFR